jgi:amidase
MGAKWSEETLIGFAYAFEQRTHIRSKVQPYILPNIQLEDVVG